MCFILHLVWQPFLLSAFFRGEIKTGKINSCDVGIHSVLSAWSNSLGLSSFLTFAFLFTTDLQTAPCSNKFLRLSCEVLPEDSRNSIYSNLVFSFSFRSVKVCWLAKSKGPGLNISLERGNLRRKDTITSNWLALRLKLGPVAYILTGHTWEAEAHRSLWVPGQWGLPSENLSQQNKTKQSKILISENMRFRFSFVLVHSVESNLSFLWLLPYQQATPAPENLL